MNVNVPDFRNVEEQAPTAGNLETAPTIFAQFRQAIARSE